MAWQIAAYALAVFCVVASVSAAALTARLCRELRRSGEAALRLAERTDETLQDVRAAVARMEELAAVCRRGLQGFSALAEGGRALGEAAERAARAAAEAADRWRAALAGRPEEAPESRDVAPLDWPELLRTLWQSWQRRRAAPPHDGPQPVGRDERPTQGREPDSHG